MESEVEENLDGSEGRESIAAVKKKRQSLLMFVSFVYFLCFTYTL